MKRAVSMVLLACMMFLTFFGALHIEASEPAGGTDADAGKTTDGETTAGGTDSDTATERKTTVIYFEAVDTKRDNYGNLIPNGNGEITVGIRIPKGSGSVSLTVRTRDMSALASSSDYEAKSQTIRLVSTETSGASNYFTVKTNPTDAVANLIENSSVYPEYSGLTRLFEIVLCDIETDSGCGYVVLNDVNAKEGSASLKCRVKTKYDYEYTQYTKKDGNSGLYLTDYLYGKSFSSAWITRSSKVNATKPSGCTLSVDDGEDDGSFLIEFERLIGYEYLRKYRNTGLADIYYGGSAVLSESSWYSGSTPAIFRLSGLSGNDGSDGVWNDIFYSEYYDPKSDGAPILFGETGYAYNGSSDYRYKLTDNARNWLNSNAGYSVSNTEDPMYSRVSEYRFSTLSGKVYKSNAETLRLSITRNSSYDMVFDNLRIDSELYDAKAPEILKTSFDETVSAENKVLRFSIRFSEPVHFPVGTDTSGLTVTGYANGISTKPLDFVYAGGEGSDTLYFECDLTEYQNQKGYAGTKISSVLFPKDSVCNVTELKKLSDYACNFEQSNNDADLSGFEGVTYKVAIDFRKPAVKATPVTPAAAAQSHTIDVTVSDMDSVGAKFCYTWVEAAKAETEGYEPALYDHCETLNPITVTVIGEGLTGEYCLYYKARSAYGIETTGHTAALKFDNTPTEILSLSLGTPNAAVSERTVTMTLSDESFAAFYVSVRTAESDWSSDAFCSLTKTAEKNVYTFTLDGEALLGTTVTNGSFYFRFATIDAAGNRFEYTTDVAYLFDTTERCAVDLVIEGTACDFSGPDDVEVGNSSWVKENNGEGKHSYRDSYRADGFVLKFTSSLKLSLCVLKKGNTDLTKDPSEYFTVRGTGTDSDPFVMTYKGDKGGYFSVQLTGDDGSDAKKNTDVFTFYLAGENDSVAGYEKTVSDKLVVNRVWTASDIKYYWMGSSGVNNESYNPTGKLSLAFSSYDMAFQYYTYMEMQDLTLLCITDSEARTLNGGYAEDYKKAQNETTTAEAGQTWIRYKSSSWNQSGDSKNWNYYFYSQTEQDRINATGLSANLKSAIASVVGKIMNKGSYVTLTSHDGINAAGIPYLDSSRIRPDALSAGQTKSGSVFRVPVSFVGDVGIYAPYYRNTDGEQYPVAAQMLTASAFTSFYYKSEKESTYTKLNVSGGFYLKDKIRLTGIVDIVERDENGIRMYSVYIDNSEPELNISYRHSDDSQNETLTKEKDGQTLNVRSFTFQALNDSDAYAYVAVYAGGVYKGAYLAEELVGVSLPDGKYNIEVYDRSGNHFGFVLKVSSADLTVSCSVRVQENYYLRFECTYPKENIFRFEIYLDGVLLVDSPDALTLNRIVLRDGGIYRIYVEDIFGNKYEKETKLTRKEPEVTWYIEGANGSEKVDETKSDRLGFIKTRLGTSNFLITTKGKVSFLYPASEEYTVEFLSGSGETSKVSGGAYNKVQINETDNWQVRISYTDYGSVSVTYTGRFDSLAPTVSVTSTRPKYTYADEDEETVRQLLANAKAGDIIEIPDVSYTRVDSVSSSVLPGDKVVGSPVTVAVSDASDLYKWSYSRNGTLVCEYTENFPESVYIGTEGDYLISATDRLGNSTSFSFSIGQAELTELSVDDMVGEASRYGHKNVVARLSGAGAFVFVLDGEYFNLTTDGSCLKRLTIQVAKDGQSATVVEKTLIEKFTDTAETVAETDSATVRVRCSDGIVSLEIALKERAEGTVRKADIKIRVQSDASAECKYCETEISDERVYLKYTFGSKTGTVSETLYVNGTFTVSPPEGISGYRVYYSDTGNYDSDAFRELTEDFVDGKEGFYRFVVCNKYGNVSTVEIICSKSIAVVGSATYLDGAGTVYSVSHGGAFYSNASVSLRVYRSAGYTVTKNGSAYEPDVRSDGEETILTVSGEGDYTVILSDRFGNSVTKDIRIRNTRIDYSEEWLDGFNDKALKKAEGYTNTKVSFNRDALIGGNTVKQITVTYGDKTVTVYDAITDSPIAFDEAFAVGDSGDGVYQITFRDLYGNKATKTVHYRSQSPLTVSRTTRNAGSQSYAIDAALLENGVWSNQTVELASDATEVLFKVNSEVRNLPYTFDFPNGSDSGKFEYTVEYTDEYGFSYTFVCVLYRASVEIDVSAMHVANGITKDPVSVVFAENCTAEIFLNDTLLGTYESGGKYLRDGNYVIRVSDRAGNIQNYSVKRDSVAEFGLYSGDSERELVSGEITNETSVRFAPKNGDAVSYDSVYLNGKAVDGFQSSVFGESGKWEIIVRDEIGNKEYFCFYIVPHALVSFDYLTPYGYRVTEVTYDSGGGKVDWIDSVEERENGSYLAFEAGGKYEVVMTSELTGKTSGFTIVIDPSVPQIVLNGAEDGVVTKDNVRISGYETGDTVLIYRDGALWKEIKVLTASDVPEITEKGDYRIVVINEAGGKTEVGFTRVYTANTATSALIIALTLATVIGLFVGLLLRKKPRID